MPLETLLEVSDYSGPGYRPLVDYGAWRVAFLRYTDELLPERLAAMQRHAETDEVFVLLTGRCLLFVGEGGTTVSEMYAMDMQPLKIYNVKRGVWHTHTLSPEAVVLIVENRDTTLNNSPQITLNEAQRRQLVGMTSSLWK
jgi:ureidoglycolate hydrolase